MTSTEHRQHRLRDGPHAQAVAEMARKRGKVRCSQTPRGCALPTILPIAPSDLGHHPVRQGALQLKRLSAGASSHVRQSSGVVSRTGIALG